MIDLPYTQSFAFNAEHPDGSSIVYLLDSKRGLRSLAASQKISTSTIPTQLSALPVSPDAPFTAILNETDGSVALIAGSCSSTALQLWTYKLDSGSPNGAGRWVNQTVVQSSSRYSSTTQAQGYLAAGASFGASSMHVFGGLCPSNGSTAANWNSAATYSNELISYTASNEQYTVSTSATRGGPVAEAGLSVTPLATSDSSTRQYLLLGGQTQGAFINTSQIALLSLPQASWSFVSISGPQVSSADLLKRAAAVIEPRSGHTAILTDDKARIVVFGGWVGDVTNPASPQIAVLEVGAATSQWQWAEVINASFPIAGYAASFGHGATMLPGDIMLVSGGYSISTSGEVSTQDDLLLYNVTSGAWIDSTETVQVFASKTSKYSTISQQVGLGVGLTLGVLLIGVASAIAYFIRRKHKLFRGAERQEKVPSDYAQTMPPEVPARDVYQPIVSSYNNLGHLRGAERTGYDLDIPSPKRGLRKGRLPPVPIDEPKMVPIKETDEAFDDPFRDPPAISHRRAMSPDKFERTISTLSDHTSPSNVSSVSAPRPLTHNQPVENGDIVKQGESLLGDYLSGLIQPDFDMSPARSRPIHTHSRLGGWVGSVRRAVLPGGGNLSLTSTMPAPLGGFMDAAHSASYRAMEPHHEQSPQPVYSTTFPLQSLPLEASLGTSWRRPDFAGTHAVTPSVRPPLVSKATPPRMEGMSAYSLYPRLPLSYRRDVPITDSEDPFADEDDYARDKTVQLMYSAPREKLRVVNPESAPDSD